MARVSFAVNRSLLEDCIREVENKQTFSTQLKLHKAVENLYNSKAKIKGITFSIVMLRIKEWNIQIKTQKGKRGLAKGVPLSAERKQKMQDGRKENSKTKKLISSKKNENGSIVPGNRFQYVPSNYHALQIKAETSLAAAVKANCYACQAWTPREDGINKVKECKVFACPMWTHRPGYKTEDNCSGEVEG